MVNIKCHKNGCKIHICQRYPISLALRSNYTILFSFCLSPLLCQKYMNLFRIRLLQSKSESIKMNKSCFDLHVDDNESLFTRLWSLSFIVIIFSSQPWRLLFKLFKWSNMSERKKSFRRNFGVMTWLTVNILTAQRKTP